MEGVTSPRYPCGVGSPLWLSFLRGSISNKLLAGWFSRDRDAFIPTGQACVGCCGAPIPPSPVTFILTKSKLRNKRDSPKHA